MNIHIKSHKIRIKSREKSPWPDIDPPVEDPRLQALRCSNPLVHSGRGNFSGGQPDSRNNRGRPGLNDNLGTHTKSLSLCTCMYAYVKYYTHIHILYIYIYTRSMCINMHYYHTLISHNYVIY